MHPFWPPFSLITPFEAFSNNFDDIRYFHAHMFFDRLTHIIFELRSFAAGVGVSGLPVNNKEISGVHEIFELVFYEFCEF